MARSFHQNFAHIIFSTKDRLPLISAEFEPELYAYLGGVIRDLNGTALAINGMPDHVHILAKTPKSTTDSALMRDVKANSSKWLKSRFPSLGSFAWQGGYGWFSVSKSNVDQVRDYISGQKEHHQKATFKDELLAFLNRNGIDYDERFLWE